MHRRLSKSAALLVALCACTGSPASTTPPKVPPTSVEAIRSVVPARIEAACGTPIIDGVLSPGEWDNAVKVRFGAALPESVGGGMVPAEVMAMSDAANLYVAYRYESDTSAFAQSHVVELDANHSGKPDNGDDAWLMSRWPETPGTLTFADDYRGPCLVNGSVQSCAPMDTDPNTGFGQPGTSDGGAAIHFGANETVVEMWHPYNSGDARDVSAMPGDNLPLNFFIRLLDSCPDYPRCYGDTYFPASSEYRPFRLDCGAPPPQGDDDEDIIEVHIDVKPGDTLPTIQLGSNGVTTVAVLGSAAFDVSRIDAATVWFAGAPVAQTSAGATMVSFADVNADGLADFVAQFQTRNLLLQVGDTSASIAGRTLAGRRFHGTDSVRVIP